MAFLTVAGVTVPVSVNQFTSKRIEVGTTERAFDGTMRSSIRARKNEWSIVTAMMPAADAESLISTLEGTPPLSAAGDLVGSTVSTVAHSITRSHMKMALGEYESVAFTLSEI